MSTVRRSRTGTRSIVALCRSAALAAIVSCGFALASSQLMAADALDRIVSIDIPPQSLEAALRRFAEQTKLQVMLNTATADGHTAERVRGTLSARVALNQLLTDSGLSYHELGNSTVTIEPDAVPAVTDRKTFRTAQARQSDEGQAGQTAGAAADSGSEQHPAEQQAGSTANDSSVLGEVLVTAQRRSERIQDVPLSITVRTADQLEQAGIADARSLEQVVPGLSFTSQGAWAEPNLRGISTGNSGAGEESPIAIYVDGVYQVSQVASIFQMPDVDQVEVLKGPQGTLFGRNAEGGAIQIRTKEPSFTPTGDLTASYGYYTGNGASRSSPDTVLQGFLGAPLIGDIAAGSVSFYTRSVDGYLNNIVTDSRDGSINTQMFRAKLLLVPREGIQFLLSGWYSENRDNADTAPTALNGESDLAAINTGVTPNVPYYPGAVIPSRPWTTAHDFPTYIHTETYGGSLRATFEFGPGTLTSLTSLNSVRNNVRVDVDSGYIPPGPERNACLAAFACIDYGVTQPAYSTSQEFVWASRIYHQFNYVAGLFLFRSDEHFGANINQTVFDAFTDDDRVVTRSVAGFLEGNYKFSDQWTLILGGRMSYEKKDGSFESPVPGSYVPTTSPSWNAFTPRASLRYSPDELSNVYFTYSKGFKSGVINPSPPFAIAAPESLTSYEIGYKRNTPLYSIAASAFYYDYRDLQIQEIVNTTYLTTNAAKATIKGLDVDGSLRVTSDLQLRLSGSYLPTARYDRYDHVEFSGLPVGPSGFPQIIGSASGERILKTPKFTGTFSGVYTHDTPWGLWQSSASLYYSDSFFWELNYRVQTAAHEVVNAETSLTLPNSKLKLTLWGKNLSNAAYVQGFLGGDTYADMAVYAPPREIGASLNYKF